MEVKVLLETRSQGSRANRQAKAREGRVREDGRFIHDMYVYEVKKPSESKYAWDYYKLRAVIPGDEAFRPLSESKCPLVKK